MADISNLNFYELLDIPYRASHDEIEDAYHDLARKLHPDVTGNNPVLTERYMFINQAYQVLSHPIEREKYDLDIGVDKLSGKQTPESKPIQKRKKKPESADMRLLDARLKHSIKQAENLCRKGDFWQATRLLEKYLKTHPDNAHLRKTLAIAATGRKRFHEAVNHVKIACKIEYTDVDNFVMLAGIYIQAGQLLLAEKALTEALSWNAEHEEAIRMMREIRILRDRKKPVIMKAMLNVSRVFRRKEE